MDWAVVSGQRGRRKNLQTGGHLKVSLERRPHKRVTLFNPDPGVLGCWTGPTFFSSGALWARVKPSRIFPAYKLSLHFPVDTTTGQRSLERASSQRRVGPGSGAGAPLLWVYCCGAVQP